MHATAIRFAGPLPRQRHSEPAPNGAEESFTVPYPVPVSKLERQVANVTKLSDNYP